MRRWALLWAGAVALLSGCPGRQPLPQGPPPEYEKPVLPPWDAGQPKPAADPFAAAAEGKWIDDTGDAGNADAAAARDAGTPVDATPDRESVRR